MKLAPPANTQRSEETRARLMRSAERLFSQLGIENVSVRAIMREAGQKNESALQYHFGNREGLISALQAQRTSELNALRSQLLASFRAEGRELSLRNLVVLMVRPPFDLCRSDPGFREFIAVFGQLLLSSSRSVTKTLARQEYEVQREIGALLRENLKHLNNTLFEMRFENVNRFVALSMSKRARDGDPFKGKRADLFFHDLADTLTAMLSAPVSKETRNQLT